MHELQKIYVLLEQSPKAPLEKHAYFFKTQKGEYGEHDQFIGISVPNLRKIAKAFSHISMDEIQVLFQSHINEERLLALLIIINQYEKSDPVQKIQIYDFYVRNLKHVNNWNLVDASAHLIVGAHLCNRDREILLCWAQEDDVWKRRIAMVSTWYFIRNNDLEWTFKIAKILLQDKHDLINKAVGWMLREAGKRNLDMLLSFLGEYAPYMNRTTLRYAIEKLDPDQRRTWMKRK